MSGLITVKQFRALGSSTLSDEDLERLLVRTQIYVESYVGISLGASVAGVEEIPAGYRVHYCGCLDETNCGVEVLGGGAAFDAPVPVIESGCDDDGFYVDLMLEHSDDFAPTRLLPVVECDASADCGCVYLSPSPVFKVHRVRTRHSPKVLWSDACVKEVDTEHWDEFKACGVTRGIQLDRCAQPMAWESGKNCLKGVCVNFSNSVRVKYSVGFFNPPKTLLQAGIGLSEAVAQECGELLKSESGKGYSYQRFSPQELAAIPNSFQSLLDDLKVCLQG